MPSCSRSLRSIAANRTGPKWVAPVLTVAFALVLSQVASAARLVDVRVGVHPGYTRVVLETDAKADHGVAESGNEILVHTMATGRSEVLSIGRSPHIQAVRVSAAPEGGTDVRIELKGEIDIREMVLSGPNRVVIDLYDQGLAPAARTARAPSGGPADRFQPTVVPEPEPAARPTPPPVAQDPEPAPVAQAEPVQPEPLAPEPAPLEQIEEVAVADEATDPVAEVEELEGEAVEAAEALEGEAAEAFVAEEAPLGGELEPLAMDEPGEGEPDAWEEIAAADELRAEVVEEGAPGLAEEAAEAARRETLTTPQPVAPPAEPEGGGLSWLPPPLDQPITLVILATLLGALVFLTRRRRSAAAEPEDLSPFTSEEPFAFEEAPAEQAEEPVAPAVAEDEADFPVLPGQDVPPLSGQEVPEVPVVPAPEPEQDEAQASIFDAPAAAVASDTDISDSDLKEETPAQGAVMDQGTDLPTSTPTGFAPGGGESLSLVQELERRLSHLETRLEEVVDAKERLERQVAAQTEELRVQRAAIARTQRVLRGLTRPEDEATEPALKD